MDPLAAIDARLSPGVGVVPRPPPADAARKWLRELPARGILDTRSVGARISFTRVGLRVDELRAFFDAAKRAAKKSEKICESGNTYGVNRAFAAVNARRRAGTGFDRRSFERSRPPFDAASRRRRGLRGPLL